MANEPDPRGAEPPTATDAEVEAYQTDEGVVLYDSSNPLAWIESRAPVLLDDAA